MIGADVHLYLVAAFVKMLSFLAKVFFVLILMLTRSLLKFLSLHIGSNYLCTTLELAHSLKMEAIFLVYMCYVMLCNTMQCILFFFWGGA